MTGGVPDQHRYESSHASIDELMRAKGVKPIRSLDDLARFLEYTYAARRAELA